MKLSIKLKHHSKVSLHEQLYQELRRIILSGAVPPSQRMPSSRQLANFLNIARSTVTDTYMQLLVEGYLETKKGSGTFVTHQLPQQNKAKVTISKKRESKLLPVRLSKYGENLAALSLPDTPKLDLNICFYGWRPAFDFVPLVQWSRTQAKAYRNCKAALLDYSADPLGHMPLREAIANACSRSRGVKCTAGQVIIVLGFQQAMDLVSRIHINEGNTVVVEEPGYPQAREIFKLAGAQICPVKVDAAGLKTETLLDKSAHHPKLIYLTPSHQFPTGSVMSLPRRLSILAWAQKTGALIIEDDYDSEYRYGGKSIPALQGLDNSDCVIYLGTFTKILFPSMCIGYLIVPSPLVEIYTHARRLIADQIPLPLQEALADFINAGHLDRHIRKMRALYNTRRCTLIKSLKQHFNKQVTISGDSAGLHLIARFQTPFNDQEVVRLANQTGVGIINTAQFYSGKSVPGEFLLGYGNLTEKEIEIGIRRLAKAILK